MFFTSHDLRVLQFFFIYNQGVIHFTNLEKRSAQKLLSILRFYFLGMDNFYISAVLNVLVAKS